MNDSVVGRPHRERILEQLCDGPGALRGTRRPGALHRTAHQPLLQRCAGRPHRLVAVRVVRSELREHRVVQDEERNDADLDGVHQVLWASPTIVHLEDNCYWEILLSQSICC